jgi:type II secretory pathway component GspD/PulD (secretin)
VQTSQVFDGLMIGVVPFIDIDGNISLSVHPVQSKVDPLSLQLVSAGGDTRITLPVVDLKSMVTQLKVRSGDAVILGGLIDQTDARSSVEVPALGRIPILGNLFRQRANEDSVRELVLVLKVTLL